MQCDDDRPQQDCVCVEQNSATQPEAQSGCDARGSNPDLPCLPHTESKDGFWAVRHCDRCKPTIFTSRADFYANVKPRKSTATPPVWQHFDSLADAQLYMSGEPTQQMTLGSVSAKGHTVFKNFQGLARDDKPSKGRLLAQLRSNELKLTAASQGEVQKKVNAETCTAMDADSKHL